MRAVNRHQVGVNNMTKLEEPENESLYGSTDIRHGITDHGITESGNTDGIAEYDSYVPVESQILTREWWEKLEFTSFIYHN